jgi:peptidoglycan/xylan/chitin deacetylase (PgdA/CDA1 family)
MKGLRLQPPQVCLTVDMERDCPPYLHTFRGVEEGMAPLLALLEQEGVRGTFFVTGEIATRYPHAIQEIVSRGHELGSHGLTHANFTLMDRERAGGEIRASMDIIRQFGPVQSFRAPHLIFPDQFLGLLEEAGLVTDSSQARYKVSCYRRPWPTTLKRVPVSVTSSVLRLPRWIRNPWLWSLSSPVVLFVHPWEFVDLRKERLRLDCRFRTGPEALACLRSTLVFFRRRGARFLRIGDL